MKDANLVTLGVEDSVRKATKATPKKTVRKKAKSAAKKAKSAQKTAPVKDKAESQKPKTPTNEKRSLWAFLGIGGKKPK